MEPMKNILPFPVRSVPTQPGPQGDFCPTCKNRRFTNSGWDETNHKTILVPCLACSGSARTRTASIQQTELIGRVFGSSQIPPEMDNWTFATYPRTGDRAAAAKILEFVERQLSDPGGKRGLYLGGDTGLGKTGLAVSLLHAVIDAQKTCLFFNEAALFKRLKATMNARSQETENDVLSIVTTVAWLVLDDVGVIKPSDYVIETYYHVVEQRRTKGLHTVMTSNLSTVDLEKYWRGENGNEFHASKRVIDRVRESYTGVTFIGKNLRKGNV